MGDNKDTLFVIALVMDNKTLFSCAGQEPFLLLKYFPNIHGF